MADREDKVFCAKLAEQAERYDGMYRYVLSYTVVLLFLYHVRPVRNIP